MRSLLRAVVLFLILARSALPATAVPAPYAPLSVTRAGDQILVTAAADVAADVATAWRVLSGYDDLARFIPGMTASRTLSRTGNHALVEQHGRAGLGLLVQSFALTLAVEELPERAIEATAVAGDFERLTSRYELVPLGEQRTRILYRATLKPRLPIPPLIGVPVMRSAIRAQFDALIAEVNARAVRD